MKDLVKVKLTMSCVDKNKILQELKNINCERITIEKLSSKPKMRQGNVIIRVFDITLSMITSRKSIYDICDILDKRIDSKIAQYPQDNDVLAELNIKTSYSMSVEEIEHPYEKEHVETTCDKSYEPMEYSIGAKESAEKVREEVFGKQENCLDVPEDKIKIAYIKII